MFSQSLLKLNIPSEYAVIGESDMHNELGYPLALSYVVVIICLDGRAVINIDFQTKTIKANDIVILGDDRMVTLQRKSANFRIFIVFLRNLLPLRSLMHFQIVCLHFCMKTPFVALQRLT